MSKKKNAGWCSTVITLLFTLFWSIMLFQTYLPCNNILFYNDTERTKIESENEFNKNCILGDSYLLYTKYNITSYLESFYNSTGVQPIIYVSNCIDYDISDEDKNNIINDITEEYKDMASLSLILFIEDDRAVDILDNMYIIPSESATKIIDEDAISMLRDKIYIDRYDRDSRGYNIAKAFKYTGNAIMNFHIDFIPMIWVLIQSAIIIALSTAVIMSIYNKCSEKGDKYE